MDDAVLALIASASLAVGLAISFGYLGQKGWMGAALLGFGAALASALSAVGLLAGRWIGAEVGGWIGLIAGIVAGGLLASSLLGQFIRGRSMQFLLGMWLGFCALCIAGFVAGGRLGLLTISFPAIVIFWIGLYRISIYTLPLQGKSQRLQALRCLLTFTMRTNYPYYFIKDGRPEERVGGNPYGQFFAGPGFIYTGCDHAAYVTDGVRVKGVFDPGLSFTEMFDLEPKVLDLRPQVRTFQVQALSQDGIPIRLRASIAFRIRSDPHRPQPQLGRSFPYHREAIHQIVAGELTDRKTEKNPDERTHEWDEELVPVLATRIVQDVIGSYTVDELCASFEPDCDPPVEICERLMAEVRRSIASLGLDFVDGWISCPEPAERSVVERRVDNWKTEWARQVLLRMSEGRAERTRQIEKARAEAEAEIIMKLGRVVEESLGTNEASQAAIALRFIDCLGELVSETETQWPLPQGIDETLKRLRGEVVRGQR
jgi:regulator of protease activity HflC (stomatin/prohibitin superfamily)